MIVVAGDWLTDPGCQAIFTMLNNAGHQVFVVGGCVRNALMGLPVKDVDFATDARPDQVEALAKSKRLKSIPTGKDHGTITVLAHGQAFEVTTFRQDIDTDGRHAVVAFSDDIEQDARRRDFTMNALYADFTGQVSDPLNGFSDLKAHKVRFIGDAMTRINEDYLRILRFFRFYALYSTPDVGLDPDGLAACASNLEGLIGLSKERIGAEMRHLLGAVDPAPAVAAMAHAGVLMRIIPGASSAQLAVLIHIEQQAGIAPDWLRRLAVIGGDKVTENLKLSRADSKKRDLLHQHIGDMTPLAELAYRRGGALTTDIAALRCATFSEDWSEGTIDDINTAAAQVFPVRAADLMPQLTGPELGAKLRQLETRWIASGFFDKKADLLG